MNYNKTTILLKKIQSLHKTLKENEEHPSAMEMQLMKSYLRDFYDCFVDGNGDTDIFAIPEAAQTTEAKTPIAEEITPPVSETVSTADVNKISAIPISPQLPVEEVVNEPEKVVEHVEAHPPTETVQEVPEAITDKELIVEPQDIIEQIVTDPIDQDLLALFSENPVVDLKDKLAMMPVRDLTKALSINERYFTIQELFGGDSALFKQTLQKLDGLSNFHEAREALIHDVAPKFEWGTEAKKKKAENFIKLVRRRYQS